MFSHSRLYNAISGKVSRLCNKRLTILPFLYAVANCRFTGMLRWNRRQTYQIFMILIMICNQNCPIRTFPVGVLLTKRVSRRSFLIWRLLWNLTNASANQHVQEYIGQIQMLIYVRNYPQSQELLEEGFRIRSHQAGAVNFSAKHLLEPDQKVARIKGHLSALLDEDSEEVSQMYDHVCYQLNHRIYALWLMVAYTQSEVIRHEDGLRFLITWWSALKLNRRSV